MISLKNGEHDVSHICHCNFKIYCFCFVTLLLPLPSFMAVPYAFVTLVSSDAYLPGALALAASLKDIHPSPPVPPEVYFQTVCLVTPEIVDVSTIKHLRRAFDLVIGVEVIDQDDEKGLKLLGQCLSRIPASPYHVTPTRPSTLPFGPYTGQEVFYLPSSPFERVFVAYNLINFRNHHIIF